MSTTGLRVRFAPSPTGYLHIGGARTALFNWLIARQTGGAFILRIEDTDQTRHVGDSLAKILADLRWLGLQWDEGPEVGGACGPYLQSQRLELYHQYARRLLESGHAYYAWETPEELSAMRQAAQAAKKAFRYPRPNPLPSMEAGERAKREGKPAVVRFKMPDKDVTVNDEILGPVCLKAEELEDFVILKGDGYPTYHFACVVDDSLMKIDLVLRGQEHLMNTPKHIGLQWALGVPTPRYAHLPIIFNMNGSKMSKRDKEKAIAAGIKPPEIDVHDFRASGYLPEALINFIALMGWSPGNDREHMSPSEMVQLFSVQGIGKSNAKFDRDKLGSFNTHWANQTPAERLLAGFRDYLEVVQSAHAAMDDALLGQLLKACSGFRTFADVTEKTQFLVTPDADLQFDSDAVRKVLFKSDAAGLSMLERILPRLQACFQWTAPSLEQLIQLLGTEMNEKLGNIAQPLRVAVTGNTVSPPIFDSLALLGKERTLTRIRRCIDACRATAKSPA